MERLDLKRDDAKNALKTLLEIFEEEYSIIVRDATIQRFEYTFEAFWKYVKEYLKEKEGIIQGSPKSCFKELFSLNLITEEESIILLEMTDSRNDTSHTYNKNLADKIYSVIKNYALLMEKTLQILERK